MRTELRTCTKCGRVFPVRPEVLKSEKKLHVYIKVCDKCQRKEYEENKQR